MRYACGMTGSMPVRLEDPMSENASKLPEFNPYRAPMAPVSEVGATLTGEAPFYAVSTLKFTVMTLATAGFYLLYWFYKHWRYVHSREQVLVIVRTIFYPVTAYSLMRRVQEMAPQAGTPGIRQPGMLAFLVFFFALLGNAPDPYWLASLLSILPLLPVQAAVNELNRKVAPDADPNERFSGGNIAWIAIGALLWALILVGMFVEE
jgi:hypothetical protein